MKNPRAAPVTLTLAKSLIALAAPLVVACSDGKQPAAAHCGAGSPVSGVVAANVGADTGGSARFVPEGLEVSARPGLNSVFNVIALTLRPGSNGAELYAAVRNDGDVLACNASFSVELRGQDDQILGAGISGLMSRHFYRLTDGSDTVAGCVAPGEVTKVAFDIGWLSQIFSKGHRIRVTVASTGAPFYEPNPNTGEPLTIEFPEKTVVAKNTVYFTQKHASRIIVPE